MKIMNRNAIVLILLAAVFATGCTSASSRKGAPPAVLTPNGSDDEIAQRILELTPIGTPLEAAKQILIDAGLQCSTEDNEDTGETYLRCGYRDERDLLVTWVWDVRVHSENGLVAGATCNKAGIGP
jgi:hypothetical protein